MTQPAILYFFWGRNNHTLRLYLEGRPRVVLVVEGVCTEELRLMVEEVGSRIVTLTSLVPETRLESFRQSAAALVATFATRKAEPEWRDLLARHGLEADRFDPLLEADLERHLFDSIHLVETLDTAREQFQIELVALNEDLMLHGHCIAEWARARGVPSLHLVHGLALGAPYTVHGALHCDAMAVFGERDAEAYRGVGIPAERIHITGNPAWDIYAELKLKKAGVREEAYGKYDLNPEAPLLLFGTTWAASMTALSNRDAHDETLAMFFRGCVEWMNAGHAANIVVKDRVSNTEHGREGADRIALEAGLNPSQYVYTTDDTRLLVTAADVLVSVDSNLSVEAMLAGTPAINLMTELGLRMGPSFDAECGMLEAGPGELSLLLDFVLGDADLRGGLIELMSLKVSGYNFAVDGSAAERVANLMREMARGVVESRVSQRPPGGYVWEQLSELEDADLKGAYHDHARKELLLLLERPPRRVLDVGCATGATGELIKTAWPESHVTGIELNRAAAARAEERIDKVLGEKLEDIDFAAEGIAPGSIDTVLLADVLEHLYDPWDALLRIRPLLTEDAQVLVSLPNARNLWLLNELAGGRFPYASEGLLDITHIRWFTRAEMEKMLRETGYRVVKSSRTPTAGLQDLTRPAGSTTVETEKIVLKDVDDEEFEDLKALQIMFLAKPLKDGEAGVSPQDFYHLWQLGHAYQKRDALWIAERMDALSRHPVHHLVVIVPAGGEDRLANNIKSLGHQFYQHWKLTVVSSEAAHPALADTASIAWIQAPAEQHLEAANRTLLETEADWVGMWEAGDKLAPHALFTCADKAARHPEYQVLYSDEDRVDGEEAHSAPFFKTDFNLEMLRAAPFAVGGLLLLRHDLFTALNGYDLEMEGVEAFDLTLRAWEKVGHAGIGHLADVLYHRHAEGGHGHLSGEEIAAVHRRALERHLARCDLAARVEEGALPGTLHVRYSVSGDPLVSILVPTKNQVDFLKRCLTSLIDGTGYANCEILVLDNGSDEAEAVAYLAELRALNSPRLKVLDCAGPFNFSAMNNRGAREAQGEYLALLNNDTAVLHEEWLEEMLGIAQQADVGAVGAKLFYPDGKIQHAGVILGMNDAPAEHPFIGLEADADGYFGRLKLTQEYSAVTAACMLVKRERYLEVGGLDEQRFQVSFNDVDFCQRLRHQGYRNVFTPHARLLHEGSVSQSGGVETRAKEAKHARFLEEQNRFYDTWRHDVAFDPAFNRNLSTHGRDFLVEIAPALAWDPEWRPRPRILAHPADRFGCGEYRVIAPMRALNDAGHIMGWETSNYLSQPELFRMEPDTILLQRQVDPHQIEFIERYIRHSKAFRVYEIDDLITNIPIQNIRKKHFVEQKDLHKRFRKGISLCHRFIVSTEYLAEHYRGYIDDIVVVPNYIERGRWGNLKPARRHGAKPRVGWAGSITHDGDLAVIFDVVKATAKEIDWVFLGMCPDEIRACVAEFHPGVGLEDYPAKLASLGLDLAVAPLEDVPFNHGKSHLRLLEYGVLGYPVVCSDLTPYRGDYPVTRVPNRYKNWVEAIRGHVADRDELAQRGDALRDYIRAEWMLEDHLDVWLKAWLP
ncbi:MAG: glycosyltransferase [Pseudomonadota bacterium]|nr:glycosyltransferase [Pseudomonadota bacterium]